MTQKFLTLKQLLYLSICAFGLQFANSLQMAGTSSLYKFLGAHSSDLSLLWLAAPISGLIIQPIVGQFSDSTVTRYGKRIPYIFIWGILGCLSLLLLPLSTTVWFAALLMWLLSCSHNGCTEALRALIGDITPNQQKARTFALQTIFAGIGAGIAALLPNFLTQILHIGIGDQNLHEVPRSLQISFFIAGLVFILCIIVTVTKIKERAFNKANLLRHQKELHKKSRTQDFYQNLKEIYQHVRHLPRVIRQLSIVQMFCWFGIFCFWLYFGIAVAQQIYGMPLHASLTTDANAAQLLEKATIWTGVCFGVYQFVSVIFAILIPYLTNKISPKILHGVSLFIGGISILTCSLAHHHQTLIVNMIGFGILWGSVMTMPYVIIASEVSRAKMGLYMGIFNISITLPQIISGFSLGFITSRIFNGHAMYAIVLSGLMILVSASLLLYQENFLTIKGRLQPYLKNLSLSYISQ